MRTCAASFRNRRTGKSRVCSRPALDNGYCAEHQWVHERILALHRAAGSGHAERKEDPE